LVLALEDIIIDAEKGEFEIEESFEDVHSKIEYLLTIKLGDAGKKLIDSFNIGNLKFKR
jgi:argininosuccinate lyase